MTRFSIYIRTIHLHMYVYWIYLSKTHMDVHSQAREEMTRWGAYTSKNMIDDYKGVYEKLIAAMGRGASVEECIATIESA